MKKIILSLFVLIISACAYSPQQVTIKPDIAMEGEQYGNGRSVLVSATDERANKTLGSRGGVYEETSVITLGNDITQAIVNATKAKLATQGFNVNAQASDADMNVVVEELVYDIEDKGVIKNVTLRCLVRVDIKAGSENFSGRYKTGSGQEVAFYPNMQKNEELINKVISDTLARALSDAKLKAFLSNI